MLFPTLSQYPSRTVDKELAKTRRLQAYSIANPIQCQQKNKRIKAIIITQPITKD